MADGADSAQTESAPKKKGGGALPLIIGAVAALGIGAGAAYAVKTELVPTPDFSAKPEAPKVEAAKLSYLELPPIAVPLPPESGRPRQLRLALSIETTEEKLLEVEAQAPRILDALNTLLRAIDQKDIANPTALDRLRAQMLRRLRLATHPEAVRDLLIVEYVIL